MQFSVANVTAGQTRTLTIPDYNGTIAVATNGQTNNYALISNGTSPSWQQLTLYFLGDVSMSGLKNNDCLLFNSTTFKFVNSQLLNTISTNTSLLTQSIKTFGNYPTGAGTAIANDDYFTSYGYGYFTSLQTIQIVTLL